MNNLLLHRISKLLIIAAITLLGSELSAQAQTIDTENSASIPIPGTMSTSADALTSQAIKPASKTSAAKLAQIDQTTPQTVPQTTPQTVPQTTPQTVPETTPQTVPETNPQTNPQTNPETNIAPGRATRGGSSYIGVAGNIGLGGDSALSEGGFAVISKIGLTRSISVRPSIVIEDDPVILIPLTYDFNLRAADALDTTLAVAPYVGAGVAIETSDDASVGFLLSGGVDVPLSTNFTATAGVNAAFLDETDVGLMIGVGYNFSGL
ncbi:MAG: hypothetical protein ACHBN1_14380 [Heteroscytonema crispum UTEX LB 1556]